MIKKKNNNNHNNGKRKYDWKHYLKFMFVIVIAGVVAFAVGTFQPNPFAVKRINVGTENYYIDKIKDLQLREPSFEYETDVQFVKAMHKCIDYLNFTLPVDKRVPYEMITAQAALESGWGMSRFAKEANNLYGIRVWDKNAKYLLPTGIKKWPGWGVRVFSSKCQSVKEYIRILNEHPAYEEFRELRADQLKFSSTMDSVELVKTLTKFSTTDDYAERVARIIRTVRKLETVVATESNVEVKE